MAAKNENANWYEILAYVVANTSLQRASVHTVTVNFLNPGACYKGWGRVQDVFSSIRRWLQKFSACWVQLHCGALHYQSRTCHELPENESGIRFSHICTAWGILGLSTASRRLNRTAPLSCCLDEYKRGTPSFSKPWERNGSRQQVFVI